MFWKLLVQAVMSEPGSGIGGAGHAGRRLDPRESDHVRVDFGRVEVVESDGAEAAGDRRVSGVLVGPCRVAARLVDDAEDAVGADEVPGKTGSQPLLGSRGSFLGSMELMPPSVSARAGSAAVEFGLVDVDAFLILGGGAGWGRVGRAGAARDAVAGRIGGRVIVAGIGDVVINARQGGLPPVTIAVRPGKESEGFEVLAAT